MNELDQAGDEILRFAVKFEGLLEAAKVIKKAGGLKQLAQEAEGMRLAAAAKAGEALKELERLTLEVEEAKGMAAKVKQTAHEAASEMVAKATAEAKSKIAVATQQAENILSQAKGLELSVADSIQQKRKTVEVLSKEIQEKSDILTALKKEMVALRGKLG